MKPLPRGLIAVACSLLVLARVQAIAPWPMVGGNYFEGFGTIATWTNDFASPTEATRWGSVAVNGTGTIPDGRRTTVATSVFTTSTTAGVQRGAGNLIQLSTGATDNTAANAVDLYLDFTGRAPGTLAFDWAAVANGSGSRASSLRVYTTTNGVNFVELTNAAILNLSNNVVASGSVTNIALPAGFANCATARIRFYEYNGTGGGSGQRAKIAIDNVSVTRVAPPTAITLPATGLSNTVATLNGTVDPGGAATTARFEWGLSPFNYTNLTAPLSVGGGTIVMIVTNLLSSLTPGLIYHGRLVASNALGLVRGGDTAFGSPALTLFGAASVTNECPAISTNDPGSSAIGAPLAIAGGGAHSLVLKSDGTVAAWGLYGQTNVPAGLTNVAAIAGGEDCSLALSRSGAVAAWGSNAHGQTNVPAGLSDVVAIASRSYHNMVLKSNGTVAAWGNNADGQTTVPVGLSNVVAVAAGGFHSLALRREGTVAAWGHNYYGQSTIPAGLSNVVSIAAGFYHNLALKGDGTVVAWGDGLLNDGISPLYSGQSMVPAGLSNVVSIAAGYYHSLALKGDGTVVAWGYNADRETNVPVGLSNVVAIAGGALHNLALKSDGTVVAWGLNDSGQATIPAGLSALAVIIGDPITAPGVFTRTYSAGNSLGGIATATRTIVVQDTTPPVITLLGGNPLTNRVDVPFVDPGATALDACGGSVAVTTNGTVNGAVLGTYFLIYTATDSSGNSATNSRTVVISPVPPLVATLPATGMSNTVAMLNGTVNAGSFSVTAWFEWGLSPFSNTNLTAPFTVGSGVSAVMVSNLLSGFSPGLTYHVRLVASNAAGVVRGLDVAFGSLLLTLNGAAIVTNECPGFVDTASATGAPLAIAAGWGHSLALKSDGTVVRWGDTNYGLTSIPAGLNSVVAIAAGSYHCLALKSDGTVAAWGDNFYGQTNIPVGLSNVVAISGGVYHSLALKRDGTVVAWGYGVYGQTIIPTGLSNVVAIAAGGYHSLALRRDGTVTAWGEGSYGQTIIPTDLSNVVAIAGGGLHSLALRQDGTVAAWGNNGYGQTNISVGLSNVVAIAAGLIQSLALKNDGTVSGRAGLSNVVAIAAGTEHGIALTSDGVVAAWGVNDKGQTTIPVGLSALAVTMGGTFNTTNAPGVYTRTYTSSNSFGAIATVSRTVVVLAASGPVITILGSNPFTNECHLDYTDPGATAIDTCGGTRSVTTSHLVNTYLPGNYTVTYTAGDGSGRTNIATRTVVVRDTMPPVITRLGSNPLISPPNVPFTDPGVAALDVCDSGLIVITNNPVNVTVPGIYSVIYAATDSSGNSATNSRTVIVGVLPVATTLPVTDASNTVATLNGTINPGSLPVTAWFEWGLYGATNTNLTAPVTVDSGTTTVAVSHFLSGLTPGITYRGRLVASNGLAVVRGLDVLFGTPLLTLIGADTMTNECHAAFADPFAATAGMLPIAGGGYHSLALKTDGTVAGWGNDVYGQTTTPVGLSNVVAIAAGDNHSLALKSDGTVAAWGHNGFGQTTLPAGLSDVMAVEAGGFHSLAVKNNGTVVVWGRNEYGQTTVPVGLSNVLAVAGGFSHSLALLGAGTVVGWGHGGFGQTTPPLGLSNVAAIAGGGSHSLALKSDGTVVAWGYNGDGQVIIPANLSNVVSIAAGYEHSLALKNDGTVAAWGQNYYGQIAIPAGLSNVVAIAAGGYHSLAVKRDGTVVGWGYNVHGEITVPANLRTLVANLTVGGTFNTNNLPGTYTRTYSTSNLLGGIATVTRTIVVQDTVPPVITLFGSNSLTVFTNTPFVDPGATALDACGGFSVVITNNPVNVAVPGNYTVSYIASDDYGNSSTNTRTVVVVAPPRVISPIRLGNGTFQFGFTNLAGVGFTVWVSTNVALPFAQWSNLGAPVESPAGTFLFTDPQSTNRVQRFYRVSSP